MVSRNQISAPTFNNHFSETSYISDKDRWHYSESISRFSRGKWRRTESWRPTGPYQVQLLQETLARVRRRFSRSIMRKEERNEP